MQKQYEYNDITFIITESEVIEGYVIKCIDNFENEEVEGYFSTLTDLEEFMLIYFDFIEHEFIVDMYEDNKFITE